MATNEVWNDPYRCPFCGQGLRSPGSGFMTHVEESQDCEDAFDAWRGRVGDDVVGGWSG